MIYKVVDHRALGRGSVFGSPQAAVRRPAPAAPAKKLGQAAQAALDVTKAQYDKAKGIYDRVLANQPNLVLILGQEKAAQAVREAQVAMDGAAQAYNDSLEVAT